MDLKPIRIERGLTQQQLADMAGINRVTVARYETGATLPRATIAVALARVLGVTVDRLLKEGGELANNRTGRGKARSFKRHNQKAAAGPVRGRPDARKGKEAGTDSGGVT